MYHRRSHGESVNPCADVLCTQEYGYGRQHDTGGGGRWYQVDDGGAVAFRSAPEMDARTDAIARPRDLIWAAREPEEFLGWVQTVRTNFSAQSFL